MMAVVAPQPDGQLALPFGQNSPLLFGVFLVTGMVLGKLVCLVLDDVIGSQAGVGDRLAGAALVVLDERSHVDDRRQRSA